MSGKFIVLDGTECSGKTTQQEKIAAYLRRCGKTVYTTREPGGTAVGEAIRKLILSPALSPDPQTELLLIFAARCEHLAKEIRPRLARGQWVLSDRFNDATYAYQGYGRGLPREKIAALESWLHPNFQPDLSLILGVTQEVSRNRLIQRKNDKDRMEQEDPVFFQRVVAGYRARSHLAHAVAIDACDTVDTVFARIVPYLDQLIAS